MAVANLKGISLEGVPLDPTNLPTACAETLESLTEDIRNMAKCVKKHLKSKFKKGRRGKHGPVKFYNQDEIKNIEFERMLKMAETHGKYSMKRALSYLFTQTYKQLDKWVSSSDMAEALNIPIGSASGLLSRIDRRMGDLLIIENIGVGKARKNRRRIKPDCPHATIREFVEEFYTRGQKVKTSKLKKQKKKVEPETAAAPPTPEPELTAEDLRKGFEDLAKEAGDIVAKLVAEKISEAAAGKLDLNVNVTGEVKVRFLFGIDK